MEEVMEEVSEGVPATERERKKVEQSHTIQRDKIKEFLQFSTVKHSLIHYSFNAESLRNKGFDLSKRGTGLRSCDVEPIGFSLIDPQIEGGYTNPFEVEDKIEWLNERSPTAGVVEVAADIRNPLTVKDFEELWYSPYYKKAVEKLGYSYEKGAIVWGTGDFVIDAQTSPSNIEEIPQEDLKKVLTEVLKEEGHDAVVIRNLAEVLVLDPKKLRIIEE